MGFLRAIPRKRLLRSVATRTLAVIAIALLVIPQFACHCADGQVKLFCVPGKCGRACGSVVAEKPSCCASRPCCRAKSLDHGNQSKHDRTEPSCSKIPCCKLVLTTQPPGAVTFVMELPSASDAVLPLADLPLDLGCQEAKLWQHVPVESIHPPDDIVIRLLHITI